MLETDPSFRPVQAGEGYLPLEDLGLIGDGATVALVGLDGGIPWMCLPRFDSEPVFCGLLDPDRGGHFTITPDELTEARQRYEPDTGVLVTELRSPTGLVRLTDALALRSGADLTDDVPGGRGELVRSAVVLDGNVRLRVDLEPRGGAQTWMAASGLRLNPSRRPDLQLHLRSSRPLSGLHGTYDLKQGDSLDLVLSWGRFHRHHRFDAAAMLQGTAAAWRQWMTHFSYEGLQEPLVRRAAITLKLCDHWVNGSLVAAPTSSLPAPVGGVRNWDYRYTWVRDAAYTVFALRRIGFGTEADAFLGWVLDAFEQSRQPRIMYDLDGSPVPDEREDPELEGYRRSAPVRWGNGAADQRQHDVYGEILDCADQWVRGGGPTDPSLWTALAQLADMAGEAWRQPDQGIWEVRSEGRVFTYSAAMCQVALDRAAAIGERLGLPAGHPRMVATATAVAERLSAGDGLLYRYLHHDSPDGIAGDEGAFVLCSFWLVDNLAMQGRLDEAEQLYASLCARASPLGLLSEQIDPSTGEFIGNFPQAFSHIGIIASGVTLARARAAAGGDESTARAPA